MGEWTTSLWTDPGSPADVRFGAALSWLCTTSETPPPPLTALLRATPQAARWLRALPWTDTGSPIHESLDGIGPRGESLAGDGLEGDGLDSGGLDGDGLESGGLEGDGLGHDGVGRGGLDEWLAEFVVSGPIVSFGDRETFAVEIGQRWASPSLRTVDVWAGGQRLTYDDNTAYLPSFVPLVRGTLGQVRDRDIPRCPLPGRPPEETYRLLKADETEFREQFWMLHWGETLDAVSSYGYLDDGDELVTVFSFWRPGHPEQDQVFAARLPAEDFAVTVGRAADVLAGLAARAQKT